MTQYSCALAACVYIGAVTKNVNNKETTSERREKNPRVYAEKVGKCSANTSRNRFTKLRYIYMLV